MALEIRRMTTLDAGLEEALARLLPQLSGGLRAPSREVLGRLLAQPCSALLAAEEVIIPMLVDGFSFAGMADMTAQILGLRKANSVIRLTGILVNQWHNSDVVRQGEALLRTLDVPVFQQTIRRTDNVPESTFDRSPLQIYSPGSAASRDFRAWVAELLGEEAGSSGKKV